MPTFIKAGLWTKKQQGFKGELNLDQLVANNSTSGYKVYTALLTQSGGDDPLQLTTGPVTKGVTYTILANSDGDFSNVGAPDNNENTSFVAINNDTPISYGTDCQLLYNNGAPVATVLENTIGNIWFTYDSDGRYVANSSNLFTNSKTIFNGDTYNEANNGSVTDCISDIENNTISNISIWSYSRADSGTIDNALNNTPIEIRVYN